MDEKDFERIAQIVAQAIDTKLEQINVRFDQVDANFEQVDARFVQIDARFEQVDARFDRIDARFEQVDARFEQVDAKFEQFKDEIIQEFEHRVTLHDDGYQNGLAVIAEGHQMLSEKLERVESNLGKKIDKIAAEVAAHRVDTEAHHGIYRVKES
jgi:chromosome segregation ATPase